MKRLFFLLVALIGLCLSVSAQIASGAVQTVTPAVQDYFVSLAALVPIITVIAGWLNNLLKPVGWVRQVISWLVAIIASYVGWYFNLGIYADLTPYQTLLYAFGAGLAANGLFDIKVIQSILALIKAGKVRAVAGK